MNTFQEYLQYKGLSPKSINSYLKTLNKIISTLQRTSIELDSMNYSDVMELLNIRKLQGVSVRTRNNDLNILRNYFNYLMLQGLRFDNPAVGIQVRGEVKQKLYNVLSKEKLAYIYDSFNCSSPFDFRNKVMLGFYCFQGLTSHEIANLSCSHVCLSSNELTVPESLRNARRTLVLKPCQTEVIKQYLQVYRKLINPSEKYKLIVSTGSSNRISNINYKLLKKLKHTHFELESFQQIRVSVISNDLSQDNLRQMQYKYGYRYIDTIEKYLCQNVEDLRDEMERMF